MKIRVSKVKEDKGELRGLLLSFLLLLAAVAAFGTGSLGFLVKGVRKHCVKPLQGAAYSVMPLKEDIRQVWNIWKKITGSRSTMINTMCFMTDLLPISCRRSL